MLKERRYTEASALFLESEPEVTRGVCLCQSTIGGSRVLYRSRSPCLSARANREVLCQRATSLGSINISPRLEGLIKTASVSTHN